MTVLRLLYNPSLLDVLLSLLPWQDFQALVGTCRRCRTVFDASDVLRDVVLARYVPAYGVCRREASMEVVAKVDVSWEDLVLLMRSQQTALHIYPTHALSVLSGSRSYDKHQKTRRLARLTLAHSRFVLLLQSLAHSAAVGPPPPPKLADKTPLTPSVHSVRELVFPAPLAKPGHVRAHTDGGIQTPPPKKRISLLSLGRKLAPPPVPAESRALKYYSSSFGWRNARHRLRSRPPSEEYEGDEESESSGFSPLSSATSVDDTPSPPLRPKTRLRPHTFDPLTRNAAPEASELIGSNPHSLALAASRVRAPILRVFVPCSELGLALENNGEGSPALERCEDELIRVGLWEHLSVGDVVCNLGFVPPLPGQGDRTPSPRSVRSQSHSRSPSHSPLPTPAQPSQGATWLLFTGDRLVPYCPSTLLPLDNPLALPGPLYFDHLFIGPTSAPTVQAQQKQSAGSNLRVVLPYIPYVSSVYKREPEMTLMEMPVRVPSPHTPGGFALVRKWVWVTRIQIQRDDFQSGLGLLGQSAEEEGMEGMELGVGWEGEWILEGDGTKEGRELLLGCLGKTSERKMEWEVVRERTRSGRVWLRMIDSSISVLGSPGYQPNQSSSVIDTDAPPVPPKISMEGISSSSSESMPASTVSAPVTTSVTTASMSSSRVSTSSQRPSSVLQKRRPHQLQNHARALSVSAGAGSEASRVPVEVV